MYIGRGPTVASIAALTVACDGRCAVRAQVEPANTLVVEIAKQQGTVGSHEQTVGVIHLLIRESGRAVADERGHGRLGGERARRRGAGDHPECSYRVTSIHG
jgi:hypothetical protein